MNFLQVIFTVYAPQKYVIRVFFIQELHLQFSSFLKMFRSRRYRGNFSAKLL